MTSVYGQQAGPVHPDRSISQPAHTDIEVDLDAHLRVVAELRRADIIRSISTAVELMTSTYQHGGKALFFGNGGSAADATHLAAEMLGRFLRDRRPVAALALADNHSAVTAIGNDYGYEFTFARQVEALAQKGDVALGFSTSGLSLNVARALCAASDRGAQTIAFTGASPGPVGSAADVVVAVPSSETPRIQEAHLLVGHILCDRVERTLAT